jgi:hypothetical protein
MGRLLKGFAAGVFGLVALAVLLYVVSRASPIPKDEAAALARIEALPVLEGRNGFAALWSLAHDVDTSQAEALLAEEARRMAAAPSGRGESESQASVSVLQRFPTLPTVPEKAEAFCGMHEAACLAKFRSDPAVYASLAEVQQRAAAKVAALDAYDYFLNPLPPRMDAALPSYQPLTHDLTLHAQRFLAGDVDAALQGVCRDASLSRKLIASGDSLIASMVGAALQKGSAALFVDMLSELPPDHPLPVICHQAFQVDGLHVAAICPTLRAEGRWATEAYRAIVRGGGDLKLPAALFLDVDKTVARGTRNFEWYCGKEVDAAIAADLPVPLPAPPSRLSFSCIANAIGCTLVSIQAPAYADYALRLQDAAMRQKAVGTWLWLRAEAANDTRPLAERLRARPETLGSKVRDITFDGVALQVPMYEKRPGQGDAWRLPVPAWMAHAER